MLAQVIDNELTAAIVIDAISPVSSPHHGTPSDLTCQNPYVVFGRVFSAIDGGQQACWSIDAITLKNWDSPGETPLVRSAVAELRQRGVSLPPVVLRADFANADLDHGIVVQILRRTPSPSVAPFGWKSLEILAAPEKLARVVQLRNWAANWYRLFHLSFTGELKPTDLTPDLGALPG